MNITLMLCPVLDFSVQIDVIASQNLKTLYRAPKAFLTRIIAANLYENQEMTATDLY